MANRHSRPDSPNPSSANILAIFSSRCTSPKYDQTRETKTRPGEKSAGESANYLLLPFLRYFSFLLSCSRLFSLLAAVAIAIRCLPQPSQADFLSGSFRGSTNGTIVGSSSRLRWQVEMKYEIGKTLQREPAPLSDTFHPSSACRSGFLTCRHRSVSGHCRRTFESHILPPRRSARFFTQTDPAAGPRSAGVMEF